MKKLITLTSTPIIARINMTGWVNCQHGWQQIINQHQRTSAVNGLRVADAVHSLPHQHAGHQPHRHDRCKGAQHLDAMVAIGKIGVRCLGGDVPRQE